MPVVSCPCGARYKIRDSWVGKRAKCKKCGKTFAMTAPEETAPIPLADESGFLDEIGAAAARGKAASAERERAEAQAAAAVLVPLTERSVSNEALLADSPKMGVGQYFKDLIATLIFPRKLGSLMSFIIMWVILVVGIFAIQLPFCFGLVLGIAVAGWYAAYRFEVVASAAAGQEEVAMLSFEDGLLDGIAYPLLKWVGSWIVAFIPAIVYMAVGTAVPADAWAGGVSGIIAAEEADTLLLLLVGLGVFVWPMLILCVSLGGFQSLARVDLLLTSMVRTLPVYILTVAIVMGTQFIDYSWRRYAQKGAAKAQVEGTPMEKLVDEDSEAPDPEDGEARDSIFSVVTSVSQGEIERWPNGRPLTRGESRARADRQFREMMAQMQAEAAKDAPHKPLADTPGAVESNLGIMVVGVGLILYVEIVAMRAIGLYYFHFKRRFAWDWG